GNFGFGDTISGYSQWDGSITAGTSWNSGNAFISVTHSERDGILNGETSWASGEIFDPAGDPRFASTQCIDPVGSELRYFFFGAGWTNNPAAPGAGRFPIGTACDQVASQTYLPKQERTSVFGSLSQELADNIDLRVTGYWTKRDTTIFGYPAGSSTSDSVFVPPAVPPAFGTVLSIPGGTGFSYGAHSDYVNRPNRVGYETWGITPELTAGLRGDWQLRTSLHYGQSTNHQIFTGADNALALAYIAAGQLDPLNVGAANSSVIQDITDFQNDQQTKQTFFMFRSVADGSLFALPGGDAKMAVGIEYLDTNVQTRLNAGKAGALASVPWSTASASSKSVFGEITLPVTSFLDLNGSLRFDDYSNFGSTTNPNIGFSLKPTEWFKVFGHWNTSFNAPTALDALAISTGRFACPWVPGGTNRPNNSTGRDNGLGACALVLDGSAPGVQPQTAKSWAVGFEATPVSGLRFGALFYSIDFKNILGSIDSQRDSSYVARPDLFAYNGELLADPTILSNYYAELVNGAAVSTQQPLSNIALIADLRTTNLSNAKIEGVDFHIYYDTDVSFGHLAFGVNGNLVTKAVRSTAGVQTIDRGNGSSKLTASTYVGWKLNGVSAKVTVNYSGKYTDDSNNFIGALEPIKAFTMVNLNLGYDFGDSAGALSGTKLRVNVDNVFNKKPQRIMRANTNSLAYEHWTLGRVFKFGITKEFK
ncbi:MAG: TonB-dependent receptor, partial [Novosphingobium sp.]|nr:TonB-dependent receptor [Novosphingobium sp.]